MSDIISHTIFFLLIQSTIFAVGGVFLIYAEQFKIYSSFCALYSKVKDILNAGNKTKSTRQN